MFKKVFIALTAGISVFIAATASFVMTGCAMKHDESHDSHEHAVAVDYELSGKIEDGARIVEVKASRYKFEPDPIVVKYGEKVRLVATSADVEHGIAIAEFGVNLSMPQGKASVAEFIADKKGRFHVRCSVYCGPGHGHMHGELIVK